MGGSAQIWHIDLSEPIEPGSDLELHLVLTKFGAPDVRIGYEIRLEGMGDDAPASDMDC